MTWQLHGENMSESEIKEVDERIIKMAKCIEHVTTVEEFEKCIATMLSAELNEHERGIIRKLWYSINAITKLPLMDILPATTSKGLLTSMLNEEQLLLTFAKTELQNMFDECIEFYKKMPEFAKQDRINEVENEIERCVSLSKLGPILSGTIGIYIINLMNRKVHSALATVYDKRQYD